jgi:hypothetical protein
MRARLCQRLLLAPFELAVVLGVAEQATPPDDRSNALPPAPSTVVMPGRTSTASAVLGTKRMAMTDSVRINDEELDPRVLAAFGQQYGIRLPPGDYWYDRLSGGWGLKGGPCLGITLAGVAIGGPLKADASAGTTSVFINGRQLHWQDVVALQSMGIPVQRGRWWVDAAGNLGPEGGGPWGNLVQLAASSGRGSYRATSAGYLGSDGQTSYFFDPKTGSTAWLGG